MIRYYSIVFLLLVFPGSAFAAEPLSLSVGPYIGYRWFDASQGIENNIDYGVQTRLFFSPSFSGTFAIGHSSSFHNRTLREFTLYEGGLFYRLPFHVSFIPGTHYIGAFATGDFRNTLSFGIGISTLFSHSPQKPMNAIHLFASQSPSLRYSSELKFTLPTRDPRYLPQHPTPVVKKKAPPKAPEPVIVVAPKKVSPPPSPPAPPPIKAPLYVDPKVKDALFVFQILIGPYGSQGAAYAAIDALSFHGFAGTLLKSDDENIPSSYFVKTADTTSLYDAQEIKASLIKLGYDTVYIRRVKQ